VGRIGRFDQGDVLVARLREQPLRMYLTQISFVLQTRRGIETRIPGLPQDQS